MNNGVGSRVVLPIVLPIVVLLSMGAFIGSIALTLLYNTKNGALMLAAVAAAGILFTVSISSAQDRLGAPRRAVVLFAAALPILAGVAIATGILGDVADDDRMINVKPLLVIPDDAPVIAAIDSLDFCLGDPCQPIEVWEVTPSAETERLVFVFDNREVGVQHNVAITDLAGDAGAPEAGSTTFLSSTLVPGPAVVPYMSPDLTWDDLPEEWYFLCAIHPNMNGVGRVVSAG